MKRRWELHKNDKVCSVDIDGVLNYYPQPWVDFINHHYGTKNGLEFTDLREAKNIIPYQSYKDLKYQYRDSGVKERLLVRTGAKELLHQLKAWGYEVVMLTSRPFDEHRTLQLQTIRWLQTNQLPFDQLISGKHKYSRVTEQLPHLKFHIEDHRYYANLIAQWGYRVYLVNSYYNQGEIDDNVIRIDDLEEVLDCES